MINNFPVGELSKVAEKESWRKEINRPLYHIHKWWAQRLGSVFRGLEYYLLNNKELDMDDFYSRGDFRGKIIYDPFMGSGTTLGEGLKLGAKVIGSDINPISTFLVKQSLKKITIEELDATYLELEKNVSHKIKKYYQTTDVMTGERIPVLYYFWVKVITVPSGEEVPLFNNYVFAKNAYPSKKPEAQILCPKCWGIIEGKYDDISVECTNCHHVFNPQQGPVKNTKVVDSHGNEYKIKDIVSKNREKPKEKMYALLALRKNGDKVYQKIQDCDLELYNDAHDKQVASNTNIPSNKIAAGYNTNQAIGYNYHYWKDFFNDRQLLCLNYLLETIMNIKNDDIREHFLCLFSSCLEFNNMFCSYKGEGTGAVRPLFSNHILKPERTPLENSIWGTEKSSGCFSTLYRSRLLKAKKYLDEPFEIRIDKKNKSSKVIASDPIDVPVVKKWEEFEKLNEGALVLNGDSSCIDIPNKSVNFVITDPPYFDFINYSELSDFFFAWLSPVLKNKYGYFNAESSRRNKEVQQSDSNLFSELLGNVFKESYRVLKDGGELAFTFHHSKTEGWIAISEAIKRAGFYIDEIFPIHAELMASTPKAGAKEPISIDAVIICSKQKKKFEYEDIIREINNQIDVLEKTGKKLSQNDYFVIISSMSLCFSVNNNLDISTTKHIMEQIYEDIRH